MKKLLVKFMSLFLVMFLLIQDASNVAMAQSTNNDERTVSAQGASIQETKIDPHTTEYLINSNNGTFTIQETIIDSYTKEYLISDSTTGELSLLRLETKASGETKILGWYISDGENISSQSDSSCDFTMKKTNGTISYQESGKKETIISTKISQTKATSITTTALTFPTAWSSDSSSYIANLESLSRSAVVGALLLIYPFSVSVVSYIAGLIMGVGSMFIDYTETYWSRALSLLEQERYYVYTFYNGSAQIYEYPTPHEIIYLG